MHSGVSRLMRLGIVPFVYIAGTLQIFVEWMSELLKEANPGLPVVTVPGAGSRKSRDVCSTRYLWPR